MWPTIGHLRGGKSLESLDDNNEMNGANKMYASYQGDARCNKNYLHLKINWTWRLHWLFRTLINFITHIWWGLSCQFPPRSGTIDRPGRHTSRPIHLVWKCFYNICTILRICRYFLALVIERCSFLKECRMWYHDYSKVMHKDVNKKIKICLKLYLIFKILKNDVKIHQQLAIQMYFLTTVQETRDIQLKSLENINQSQLTYM
jgi:hypothetical protein